MNAYKVGGYLACPECGYVMEPSVNHKKRPGVGFARCRTLSCENKGKVFKFALQTIALTEVDYDPAEQDMQELMDKLNASHA